MSMKKDKNYKLKGRDGVQCPVTYPRFQAIKRILVWILYVHCHELLPYQKLLNSVLILEKSIHVLQIDYI